MENPATWNQATHIIQDAITKFHKACDEGICGASMARTIHDDLQKAGLLITPENRDMIRDLNYTLEELLEKL
jgi:hypothetical protein